MEFRESRLLPVPRTTQEMAASATVVAAASGAAPPQEGVTLIFDRPFLYGIVDLQNGVPLFLGTFEGL